MREERAGAGFDERALVLRQLRAASRAALRTSSWLGMGRELALGALHVAAYPWGIVASELSAEPPPPPRGTQVHPALVEEPGNALIPVLLVHGWVHNRSAFIWMTRALRRAGIRHVHGLNYNPLRGDIPTIARVLATEVERLLALTGAPRCMIVGHSMGGIVARYYVQVLGGDRTVDTVVTLGSPHRGTYTAFLGAGPAARQLRPRTPLMRELEESARPSSVRWIAYYSDLDLLITPAVHGKLVHPALRATNLRTRDTGHLSLLLCGDVLRSVVDHLADRQLGWTGPAPRPALSHADPAPDAEGAHPEEARRGRGLRGTR